MNRSGFASKCTDLAAQVAIGAALVAGLLARPARAEIPAPLPPAASAMPLAGTAVVVDIFQETDASYRRVLGVDRHFYRPGSQGLPTGS